MTSKWHTLKFSPCYFDFDELVLTWNIVCSMWSCNMLPGEESAAVTPVFSGATSFGMRFPIRLNSVFLWTLFTFPLLLAVFSAKVLLDSSQISQSPWWIMMHTRYFWTYIDLLSDFFACSLLQLPWQVVSSSVKLKILISLKTLVADLTYESVFR